MILGQLRMGARQAKNSLLLLALLINNFTFELFAFVITITSLNLFLVLFIAFVFVFVLLANLAVEGSAYQPQPRPPALQWSRRPQRQSQVLPKCETPQILSEQVVVGISLSVCLAHYHKFLLTFEPDLQEIKITSTHFPVFAIHCHWWDYKGERKVKSGNGIYIP